MKIEELETRLVGLADSQGWLAHDVKASDSTCMPCDEAVGRPTSMDHVTDTEDHVAPSCSSQCAKLCGCADKSELKEAKAALEAAERDLEAGQGSETAVAEAKSNVETVQQKDMEELRSSASYCMSVCQTAVAMPCMVGM